MQDIFDRMQKIISDQFSVDPDEITTETSFEADLGADSVDLVELSMSLEEEFDIDEMGEEDIASIHNVGDLVNYLQGKLGE